MPRGFCAAGLFAVLAACSGGGGGAKVDASPSDAATPDAAPRMTLADTGLYSDPSKETLAPGVVEYHPAYRLWSDGAVKRRFVLIPDGSQIDTSDMNFWTYPVGTKLWKEFTRDGVRVETRLLWKQGEGDWFHLAFAWNQEQTEAVAVPEGRDDVLGTDHDIPAQSDCEKCHIRQPDFALGFTAVQLDHDPGGLTLDDLVSGDLLTDPPAGSPPYFPIPGDSVAQAALGYLNANCGGCHHERSDVMDETPLSLRLDVGKMGTVEETPTYTSAVGMPPQRFGGMVTSLIEPGDPAASAVHARMSTRDPMNMMPPLATEIVDDDGVATVDAWITALGN